MASEPMEEKLKSKSSTMAYRDGVNCKPEGSCPGDGQEDDEEDD